MYTFCLVGQVASVLAMNKISAAAAFGTATPNTRAVNSPRPESNYIASGGNDDDSAVEPGEINSLDDEMSIFLPYLLLEAWNSSRDTDLEQAKIKETFQTNPYGAEIFHKAQDNSHNRNSNQSLDRTVNASQEKLLHAFRMLGNLSTRNGSDHLHTLV